MDTKPSDPSALFAEASSLVQKLDDEGITVAEDNGIIFVEEGEVSHPACAAIVKRLQAIFDADPEAFHATAMR